MSKITTIWTYQLNNVQTEFAVNFDYLSRKFVQVTLIGKDRKVLRMNVDYRFIGPKTIKTTKAWGSNDGYTYLEIRRVTSATDSIVDFSDGSILRAGDLTIANLQSMHIAEEARNLAGDALGVNDDGQLDARARRIVNLGNPVGRLDAVNKAYVDDAKDGVIQSRDKALQYRNEASQFRNAAEAAKNQASTYKTQAESAKTGAESAKNTAVSKASEASSSATKATQAMANAQGSASNAVNSEKKAKASETAAAGSAKRAEDAAAKAVGGGIPMVNLVQTTGQGTDKVMSQKAVTDLMMPKTGGTFSGPIKCTSTSPSKALVVETTDGSGDIISLKSPYGSSNVITYDKQIRFYKTGSNIVLPNNKTGTIALTEDYVPKVGGTFSGPIKCTSTSSSKALVVETTDGSGDIIALQSPYGSSNVITYDKQIRFYKIGSNIVLPNNKTGTIALISDIPRTVYRIEDTRSSLAKSKLAERSMRKEIEDLKAQVAELKELINAKH